jgi:hypothetical protein
MLSVAIMSIMLGVIILNVLAPSSPHVANVPHKQIEVINDGSSITVIINNIFSRLN